MKKIMFIALLVGLSMLYVFDNDMFDLADFKCEVVKRSIIGYPIRMCSIAFDDKGVIGKVADRL
tara:strand:+ start:255 stop:446 length:192 start_codon:yes stop_codon:yes gene_type:complete